MAINTQRSTRAFRRVITAAALVACAGMPAIAQDNPAAASAAKSAVGTATKNDPRVRVDENNLVDLHVADEDLATVLEMLSIQSQKNIIASKNVSSRVTANLYRVTFFEALDAILNANGLGYVEQGNFVYVYTLDELKEIEKASRVRISRVIELNYLNSNDAAEFVKPLLSDTGQIKTNGKTAQFPSIGDTPTGSDEYSNSAVLVVFDYEQNVAEIETLVRSLDTRPAQVLVEATILQTQLSEDNAFGVDFSIIANMNFGDFVQIGGPLQAANSLIGGRSGGSSVLPADRGASAISSTVGNTASKGGLKVGVVSNDVAVFLRVLDEVTDTTIVSNPKILTLNRQPSRVLVGRKVGYLSTTTTDTASTQTVEFLDTGTQLYFRPFVTTEGMIRMELKPQVSDAVIRETTNSSGGGVTIPDELTNELTTNVLVRDGQTVVLGGLFSETTKATRRQIPLLGDIPVLGSAFRGNEDNTNRNEIIFLVTPTIINDQALADQGKAALESLENVRAGTREGLLFWSRERRTAMLNLEAQELARAGDNEAAQWKLRQSLFLNPSQPEAIQLRARVGGENTDWPSRSMLDDILRGQTPGASTAPAASTPMTPLTDGSNTNNINTSNDLNLATFNTNSTFNESSTANSVSFNTNTNQNAMSETLFVQSAIHEPALALHPVPAHQPLPVNQHNNPYTPTSTLGSKANANLNTNPNTGFNTNSSELNTTNSYTQVVSNTQAITEDTSTQSDFFENEFSTQDAHFATTDKSQWLSQRDTIASWFAWAGMSPNASFARGYVSQWYQQPQYQNASNPNSTSSTTTNEPNSLTNAAQGSNINESPVEHK